MMTRNSNKYISRSVFYLFLLVMLASSVLSFPRLSVEQATSCKTCHINPNGGGMRNEFGNVSVAANELVLPVTRKLFSSHAKSPRIGESLLVGFDSRYLVFDDGSFFRMQTDAFLAFNPIPNLYYHFRFWENGIQENYGLVYLSNEKYYLKFGRFYPAFGLRNSDHKSFNRERTGHNSTLYLDGFSIGSEFQGVNFALEAFNNLKQNIYGGHIFHPGDFWKITYLAGASIRYSETMDDPGGKSTRSFPHAKALFGGLTYDRLTLMGEIDLVGKKNDTLITYLSLTGRINYGLYLVAEYNFFDGDRSIASGVDELIRISLELYPIPFVELRPSYTYYSRGWLEGTDDFFLQLHFGY